MKKLGLIGGLGPESTMMYYRDIVYGVKKRLGREAFPNLTVESLDVFRVLEMCGARDYEALAAYLGGAVERLAAAGADFAAISANTPHIVFNDVAARAPVPMVSIIDTARDEALRRGYARVGLLGTRYTMEEDFYTGRLEANGLQVLVPEADDRAEINRVIFEELCRGVIKDSSRETFLRAIRDLAARGAQGVILGCTEIGMLVQQENIAVPLFDTTLIHARTAALVAINETPVDTEPVKVKK